jgi:hypothetical protein
MPPAFTCAYLSQLARARFFHMIPFTIVIQRLYTLIYMYVRYNCEENNQPV